MFLFKYANGIPTVTLKKPKAFGLLLVQVRSSQRVCFRVRQSSNPTGAGAPAPTAADTPSGKPGRQQTKQSKRASKRNKSQQSQGALAPGSMKIHPRGAPLPATQQGGPASTQPSTEAQGEGDDMMQMIEALVQEGQAAASQLDSNSDLAGLLAGLGAPVDLQAMQGGSSSPAPSSGAHSGGKGKKNKKGKKAQREAKGGRSAHGKGGKGGVSAPEPPSATFAWSEFQSAAPDAAAIAAPAFDFEDSDEEGAGTPPPDGSALLASLMAGGTNTGSGTATPPTLPQQVTVTPIQTRPHRHQLQAPVDQGATPTPLHLGSAQPSTAQAVAGPQATQGGMGSVSGHAGVPSGMTPQQAQQYHAFMMHQQRQAHMAYMMQQQQRQRYMQAHAQQQQHIGNAASTATSGSMTSAAAPPAHSTPMPPQPTATAAGGSQAPSHQHQIPQGGAGLNAWGVPAPTGSRQQPRGLAAAQQAADEEEAAAAAAARAALTAGNKPSPGPERQDAPKKKTAKPALTSLVPASVAARRRPASSKARTS